MTRDLRAGDEVLVEIPGVIDANGAITTTSPLRLGTEAVVAAGGRVVLTRGIDHPSHDVAGTVRDGGWVKVQAYDENHDGLWWNVLTGEERGADDVAQHPRIGVMPGTPAAEQAP